MSEQLDLSETIVMVVEDNRHMRKLVHQVLVALGVGEVVSFESAPDALEHLMENKVDIIVSDLAMTPITGIEFTESLRQSPRITDRAVPIVMLTAHSEKSRVLRAREAGVNFFLTKPLMPRVLYDRIARCVDPAIRRQAAAE